MRAIITAALGLSLAFAATSHAQQPNSQTPGTVPYYIMHSAERVATERACAMTTGWPTKCQAAQKADEFIRLAQARQRVNTGRAGEGSMDSPAYYDRWPLARHMVLNQCAHPTGGLADPSPSACQAARISAGLRP